MDIHEYQAKEILNSFGVTIPRGGIVYSPETAENKAREIGGSKWVVKAQIHSGARGKAGGVIVCNTPLEVAQATDKLLGKKLVTNQTGPEGKIVNRIYIEEATDIEKELYLGLVFDRASESIMVVASTEGGMSVEEIAKEKPETITFACMVKRNSVNLNYSAVHGDPSKDQLMAPGERMDFINKRLLLLYSKD